MRQSGPLENPRSTLGDRLTQRDQERFVGRAAELRTLGRFLDGAEGPSVVFVHGPGGVGKSALARELCRRAEDLGYSVHRVEGRDLPPAPDSIDDALIEARAATRPLIVIDTFERIAGISGYLRGFVLPRLPDSARVLIAGRRPPDDGWQQGGWESLTADLRLEGVPDADGSEILRRNGLERGADADRVLCWARGSPLALTLGAWGHRGEDGFRAQELAGLLVRRLSAHEFDATHSETLAVAAIARTTTPSMLADVLPDTVAADEYRWLEGLSFAEPLGEGIALHELVAGALRENLREHSRDRDRVLRTRIADHLHDRASHGRMMLSADLAHLAENPSIRWGYSWEMAARLRVDDVRFGDLEEIEEFMRATGRAESWAGTKRFLCETPEHVTVIRDADDVLRGFAISVTPDSAPEFANSDPLLGPRLEHARRLDREQAVLARDVYDLAHIPHESPIPMLGMASVLRAVRGNPRFAYLPINPEFRGAPEFAAALGAEHVAALDARLDDQAIECHVVDYGPGGLLAAQREVVHVEAGLEPPPRETTEADVHEAVRAALRSLRIPRDLAANPLATGAGTDERAASVRSLLERAAGRCFGRGPNEELTRSVLVRGYLDPAASHEVAAEELAISRSAYFRRLKLATERLADYIESEEARKGAG